MPIISLIVTLIIVGVLLWGAQSILAVIPMDARIKTVIQVLIVVLVCLWLLSFLFPGVVPFHGVYLR